MENSINITADMQKGREKILDTLAINNPEYFLADHLSYLVYNILERSKKDDPIAFLERLSKAVQERGHATVLTEIKSVFLKHRRKIPFEIEPFFIAEHMSTEDPVDVQFILNVGDCMLEIVAETHEEVLCEAEM